MENKQFNSRQVSRLNTAKPMHHQVFQISLSGCPNSCSQPQIKDFGVQGQVIPEVGEGCTQCGKCVESCKEGAINYQSGNIVIDYGVCLKCGQCINICPEGVMQAKERGFNVLAGGKLGRHPRLASRLSPMAGEDHVLEYLKSCVELLLKEGKPGKRLGSIMDRVKFNSKTQF
ncbi:MAG: 4Fe-4S binding protein [Clostridiales bacterium]|nr:4Fe-4S binding protein [Clostridiales bacterium]MCF8021484.1 4Fe-4S binding protein [Clostridiales bacterium]